MNLSISSILRTKHARAFFKGRVARPKSRKAPQVLVPPIASSRSRVGMAFDYALRAGLTARGWAQPHHLTVAELALFIPTLARNRRLLSIARERCQAAKRSLDDLGPAPTLSKDAAAACCDLAGIELVYRTGRVDEVERDASPDEVADLQALYEVVPWGDFEPRQALVLNPDFGEGSLLVGGADGDLYLDGCIIDIKTTQRPDLKIRYLRQLVCYAVLANEFGISGLDEGRVDQVAVYHSRAGVTERLDLEELSDVQARREILKYLRETGSRA